MKAQAMKTRRGKKFLENRAPKILENDRQAIIVKGGKTNKLISDLLTELYLLKKPLAIHMKRNNPFHPFDDDSGLIKFSKKFDSSLFLFGSNTKKHPNSLIFGRMFDYEVLDMVELKITEYISAPVFREQGVTFGTKPCVILQGSAFETNETMKRVGNLMIDWFRGPNVSAVRLQGLEMVIVLTATSADQLHFRVYRPQLTKSGTNTPRVELVEIGPHLDFSIERKKLASNEFFRSALKKAQELKVKPRKNIATDVFGTKTVRIHVGRQQADAIQTRKVKALKVRRPTGRRRNEMTIRDVEE